MLRLLVDPPPLGLRSGEHNRSYKFWCYAATCLNTLTKLSISELFPIVTRMWFGRDGKVRRVQYLMIE